MITFEQWQLSRDIDVQSAEPELLALWQAQYDAELERSKPVPLLIIPADCQWPARGYWTPAVGH